MEIIPPDQILLRVSSTVSLDVPNSPELELHGGEISTVSEHCLPLGLREKMLPVLSWRGSVGMKLEMMPGNLSKFSLILS